MNLVSRSLELPGLVPSLGVSAATETVLAFSVLLNGIYTNKTLTGTALRHTAVRIIQVVLVTGPELELEQVLNPALLSYFRTHDGLKSGQGNLNLRDVVQSAYSQVQGN